jgi:putative transposase
VREDRELVLELIEEAVATGARLAPACEIIGVDTRTVQRWRRGLDDRRHGPKRKPGNQLRECERRRVLEITNSPKFCDLSPKQIVPTLADEGIYVASESTFYRILRDAKQLGHRERSQVARHTKPNEHVADGPHQVFSWDITYLRAPSKGRFYYLYLVEDVWSRKIVGWEVHDEESMWLASRLIDGTCKRLGIDPKGLVLHSDNGGPMKGSTMLATLDRLGIVASFSRPRVSDDNPYSEALFRTLKYRPSYPGGPFKSLEAAREWVADFVAWYNLEHLHSAIGYVTPAQRHAGEDEEILEQRRRVYERAREQNPERWSGAVRSWGRPDIVRLNPQREAAASQAQRTAA